VRILAEVSKKRAMVKFLFWAVASLAMIGWVAQSYRSGQMVRWYYYTADMDGYAVNAKSFKNATNDNPAMLTIGQFDKIEGLQAVPVKKGQRLPENTNGIIGGDVLKEGERATLEGTMIKVIKPSKVEKDKKTGFKYRDTFMHKGIKTNPWSGVWNVVMVIGLGLTLGFMAEGFTDMLGWKIKKIRHFEGH
jgi:hypothetical protein